MATIIAQAQYHNATTGQGARIVITDETNPFGPGGSRFRVITTFERQADGMGTWEESTTRQDEARLIGNAWHARLLKDYGMRRLRTALGT